MLVAAAPGHVETVRSLVFEGLSREDVAALERIAGHIVARHRGVAAGDHRSRTATERALLSLATSSTIGAMATDTRRPPPRPPAADDCPTSCSSVPPRPVRRPCTRRSRRHPELFLSPVSRSRSTTSAATRRRRRTGARVTRTATGSGSGSGSATSTSSRDAGDDQLAGESTPFYLYHRDARRRIASRPARGPARRGAAGPGRPGLLELDAPVGRRPGALRRRRRGLLPGRPRASTTAGRRSGTTAGWGCTGGSSPTCSSTSRASRCWCSRYRTLVDDPHATLNRVCRFLGDRRGRRHRDPGRQLAAVRAPEPAHPVARTRGPGRRGRGPVPAAAGVAQGEPSRSSTSCTSAATRPARGSPRSRATRCGPRSSRTSTLLERAHRRVLRRLAGAPGRRHVLHPGGEAEGEQLTRGQPPRLVIRSCAPSGRAASK